MIDADLLTRTATIVERSQGAGGDDGFGGGSAAPAPDSVEVPCYLEQQRRDEDEGSEISDTRWLLIVPAGTDLSTGNTVVVDGDTYEVAGEPWEANEPGAGAHHIEATLERKG